MENIQTLLWTKLCRFIGTEEVIDVRRRRWNLDEKIENALFPERQYIASGSKAEGLDLPGSDVDTMVIPSDISVLPSTYLGVQRCNGTHVLYMETDNIKPGFVRLRVACDAIEPDVIVKVGSNLSMSSLFARDQHVQGHQETDPTAEPHGPCATQKSSIHEYDCAKCLHCRVWPDIAREWALRYRPNKWPAEELVVDIVRDGILLVPIGNPRSDHSFLEWRISFSVAEKKLIHSFNHTQLLCYGLLKLYLKNVIDSDKEVKDLLCSYFLKTSLFYCIEEGCVIWGQNNLIVCFWTCFNRLRSWVRQGYCPNYFIIENNMFESKIHGEKQIKLLERLNKLYEEGNRTFTRIPCLSGLFNGPAQCSCGCGYNELILSDKEVEALRDYEIMKCPFLIKDTDIVRTQAIVQSLLQQTTNECDRVILNISNLKLNHLMAQIIYNQCLERKIPNKTIYRLASMMKHFILQNCVHRDICSGWLQYATLCYLTGQYSNVVHITERVLQRFRRQIKCHGWSINAKRYKKEMCGRNLPIAYKMKHATARTYNNIPCCGMHPQEIDPVLRAHAERGDHLLVPIHPVVYSKILLFLSYNALGYTELRDASLRELSIAIHDEKFPPRHAPLAFDLYERCSQIARRR